MAEFKSKADITRSLLALGIFGVVAYACSSINKDVDESKIRETRYLAAHPLTPTQIAANDHFNLCYRLRNASEREYSKLQQANLMAMEECYSDDRDDPRYNDASWPWNRNAPDPSRATDADLSAPQASAPPPSRAVPTPVGQVAIAPTTPPPLPPVRTDNQGSPEAEYQRGAEAFDRKDYPASLDAYRSAANQGYAPAQSRVGYFYQMGLVEEQDFEAAMTWYRKAADQGYAKAQYNVGALFQGGLGVPRDYEKARYWYNLAASGGHEPAKAALDRLPRGE